MRSCFATAILLSALLPSGTSAAEWSRIDGGMDLAHESPGDAEIGVDPQLWMEIGGTYGPVHESEQRRFRFFEPSELFLDRLTLNYNEGAFSARAGKFTQNFGLIHKQYRGMFYADFSGDYVLWNRVGFDAGLEIPVDGGDVSLRFGSYFRDPTGWGPPRDAGGPANTGDLSSYVAAIDVAGLRSAPGLKLHLGLVQQEIQPGYDYSAGTESGVVFGVAQEFSLTDQMKVAPMFEIARLSTDGEDGHDRQVVTAGVNFFAGKWNLSIIGSRRDYEWGDGTSSTDQMFQISTGYTLPSGLHLNAGWKDTQFGDDHEAGFGVSVGYWIRF